MIENVAALLRNGDVVPIESPSGHLLLEHRDATVENAGLLELEARRLALAEDALALHTTAGQREEGESAPP
jgi:hypothetical protein